MRRLMSFAVIGALLATVVPAIGPASAQQRRPDADRQQEQEAAKKRQRDREWNQKEAPLPALRNAGPCPYVKVLYDASRYVEFEGGR